ncbi:alpha/beta hydrolase-fold protein [Corynebacterium sanguinis]|uniref:alpha/beta hydrolase n=1 Tax=Corynebacterium sanguinis TaxID=2594913 RepID=UPI0030800243
MDALRSLSLVSPGASIAIAASVFATTLFAVVPFNRRTRIAGFIALGLLAVAVFGFEVWPKPFPDSAPWVIYAAGASAAFVVCVAVVQKGRRFVMSLVAVAALANAYLVSNLVYQEYPSVGSFYPVPVAASVDAHQFTSMKSPPKDHGREVGALVTLSAAPMRDAVAYVPPAYWRNHDLPVLVITAGSPGSPMDWFTKGDAAQSLDDFQSRHNGEAPVVVSVDATGSETGNPACSDGPEHKVLTYISTQVPEMIKANFDVNDDQSRWTVGGLSYGGTCAMQVITNHPEAYGSVLDFSGEAEPNVGSHAETVQEIFGGSEEAFQKVNAATLLDKARGTSYYDGIVGRFVAGEDDEMSTAALSHLNDLARAAGMDTTYDTVPGSHSYQVWRVAFRDNLDFVAERGGLK